jgi:hypothetical protein
MIHTLKTALCISEDDYRFLILFKTYGVKSSKDLKFDQAEELLDDLEKKAIAAAVWQRRTPPRPPINLRGGGEAGGVTDWPDDPQSTKIKALWLELHAAGRVKNPSKKSCDSYIHRMTGVSAVQWIDGAQASRVIEALKKWLERR